MPRTAGMRPTKRRQSKREKDQGPTVSDYYRYVFSIPGFRGEISYEQYKEWKQGGGF